MNGPLDTDPLDELHHADPAPPESLPSASLDRVRSRVYAEISSTGRSERRVPLGRFPIRFGGALAAAVVIAMAVVTLPGVLSPSGQQAVPPPTSASTAGPTAAPSSVLGPGAGMCVETYDLATLAHRGLAFDGTVTAITGDQATFRVNTAFRGVNVESLTLTATGMTGSAITSEGGPTLVVGARYLVAGEDHFAWSCGFTQPYDVSIAATWATTFGH